MSLKQVHLYVRGRVQGVFFRASAQREARRLGLTGWVRHRADATVELLVEGEEESIKEFVGWSYKGPGAARVDSVDVRWRGFTGEFADFRITD
jgi:acylphosphatase